MNEIMAMQCLAECSENTAPGMQNNIGSQSEYHVEQQKNLSLVLNSGSVPQHLVQSSSLQLHHNSQLHCIPPTPMGQNESNRNSLIFYGNQTQINVAHESPSHVSCDSPSHMTYNPIGHMNHNVSMHVAHNSPNNMSHGSPVHWHHSSPVPMPCNSPGHIPCHSNIHMAHNSPSHGICHSPVHMTCNSGLHISHNSPVHLTQGSPSPQSLTHARTNPASENNQNNNFMPTVSERCKFCGLELPMDTVAVVAHFNSHWRQPDVEAGVSCSYSAFPGNGRIPQGCQFSNINKFTMNNRFINSIPVNSEPTMHNSESHHAYSTAYTYSTQSEASNMAASDPNLKIFDHISLHQRENNHLLMQQSSLQSHEGGSDLNSVSAGSKILVHGSPENHLGAGNRCSPLNLTGRSKLTSSPALPIPALGAAGNCSQIENSLFVHGTSDTMPANVPHDNAVPSHLLSPSNIANTGVPYQSMYPTPSHFFGSNCPYNSSDLLPSQISNFKAQQTFSHNLDNVGLSIPVLSPNLAPTDDEQGSCSRSEDQSKINEDIGDLRTQTRMQAETGGGVQSADLEGTASDDIVSDPADTLKFGGRDLSASDFKSCEGETVIGVVETNPSCVHSHALKEKLKRVPDLDEVSNFASLPHGSIGRVDAESNYDASPCISNNCLVVDNLASDERSTSSAMLVKPFFNTVGVNTSRPFLIGTSYGSALVDQFAPNQFSASPDVVSTPPPPQNYPPNALVSTCQHSYSSDDLHAPAPAVYSSHFISVSSHANRPSNEASVNDNVCNSSCSNIASVQSAETSMTGSANALFPVPSVSAVPLMLPTIAASVPSSVTLPAPKPYKCSTCNEEFNLKEDLREHFIAHEAAKPFHCDICGLGVCNQKALKRHKLTHTGVKPFKCGTCGRTFLQKHDLNRHMSIHDRPKYLTCDQCKRTFTGLSPYKNHKCKGAKAGLPFLCHICGDGCSNRLSWSYHMWKHTKNPMFVPFQENVSPVES